MIRLELQVVQKGYLDISNQHDSDGQIISSCNFFLLKSGTNEIFDQCDRAELEIAFSFASFSFFLLAWLVNRMNRCDSIGGSVHATPRWSSCTLASPTLKARKP